MRQEDRILYNIESPETAADISWSRLRFDPAVWQTLYARLLTSISITLWLLTSATATSAIEKSKWGIGSAYLIGVFVCLAGLSLLNSVRLWRHCTATPVFSNYTHFVFTVLLVWCAVTIVRVDWFSWLEVKQMLGGPYFAWAWVVPVSMVLGSEIGIWRRALTVVAHIGALGCVIVIVGRTLHILYGDFGITRACPLALPFWYYLPKRIKRIVLLASLFALFHAIITATRNAVFGVGLMILFASYIQFFRGHFWRLRTRFYLICVFSIAFIVIVYAASVDRIPFVGDRVNSGIAHFKWKLFKDTRATGSDASLYSKFLQDLDHIELMIGRGCVGKYNFDYGTLDNPYVVYPRKYIECGYFQVILHGGVIMLILMLSLAIPALYLGFFRSRNWFTRGCAFIVLGRLLEMVPFGLPVVDVRYFLFWMAVGACLTWRIRAMSDDDIVGVFTSRYALGVRQE